ncbi:MAG: hypothetical protein M1834_009069 [Cirrosporium novae-zelandiae]|nr:MAG: hypothetical protein M1834_009069 [Cirrosporium novae-zelandiae]
MPFIPHTPESLLRRDDSKNPATTCKGVTSNGRPCRRGLTPQSSPDSKSESGVLAVRDNDNVGGNKAAAFFCWQHRDQAQALAADQSGGHTNILPLEKRSSIDTLVDRLGVLDVEDGSSGKHKRHGHRSKKTSQSQNKMPRNWDDVEGPLITVPEEALSQDPPRRSGHHSRPQSSPHRHTEQPRPPQLEEKLVPKRQKDSDGHGSIFCCASRLKDEDEEDDHPPAKYYEQRPSSSSRPSVSPPSQQPSKPQSSLKPPSRPTTRPATSDPGPHNRPPGAAMPRRPVSSSAVPRNERKVSQTEGLLSFIPKTLPPQTTSQLLNELAKPISDADEAGYIYIFWLTQENASVPPSQTATSLLGVPGGSRPSAGQRLPSDVLRDYPSTPNANTLLLKIGRASNVQRRMNEWTRQCNYNLSLVRYYPYVPSNPQQGHNTHLSPSSSTPHKVPHAHRVERLIHLELGDKRVKKTCEVCGKEHREWFEVEASRAAVGQVDEVVRRWVDWAERTPKGSTKSTK